MIITRRNLLRGLVAAPAVVAIQNIMPVRALPPILGRNLTATEIVNAMLDGIAPPNFDKLLGEIVRLTWNEPDGFVYYRASPLWSPRA